MVTVVRSKEPNTLQSKMGFEDGDLKKPDHDAIMLWLDTNIERVAYSLYDIEYVPWHWNIRRLAELGRDAIEAADRMTGDWLTPQEAAFLDGVQNLTIPECKRLVVGKPKWEVPITTGQNSTYTVGFIDLSVTVESVQRLVLEVPQMTRRLSTGKANFWEEASKNVPTGKPYVRSDYQERETFRFEVKSSIPSLGELIRQIRYYQTYCEGVYVVVSPDTRFGSQLEAQGIRFVSVDSTTVAA